MSAEQSAISHIVRHGNESLTYLIEQGFTPEHFTEDRTKAAYRWLLEQWHVHGEVPSEERFNRRFKTFRVLVEPDPLSAIADEVRANYAQSIAAEMMPEITAVMKEDPRHFDLSFVLGRMSEMQERINIVTAVNEVASLMMKTSTYLEDLFAMDGKAVPGIPTGFDALDMASGGWMPENFVVIGAAPKRFKTAILVWMALTAARAGYRCTVITFEMSIKELMNRIYCMGGQVNYTNIIRGSLSERERNRLIEFSEEMQSWDGGDIEIVHDIAAATTLAGFTAQVRTKQLRPDIIFIDGLYQMHDDSREWSNETAALTAVSRGLARFTSSEKIPVVGTTQALDSRITKSRGTEMESIGYTRAFAQDANVILTIDRPKMSSNDILLRVAGARSMAGAQINLVVDFEVGTITEGGEVNFGDDVGYH